MSCLARDEREMYVGMKRTRTIYIAAAAEDLFTSATAAGYMRECSCCCSMYKLGYTLSATHLSTTSMYVRTQKRGHAYTQNWECSVYAI